MKTQVAEMVFGGRQNHPICPRPQAGNAAAIAGAAARRKQKC
jgi:hypothetical protein